MLVLFFVVFVSTHIIRADTFATTADAGKALVRSSAVEPAWAKQLMKETADRTEVADAAREINTLKGSLQSCQDSLRSLPQLLMKVKRSHLR